MDLNLTPEALAFQDELRTWLRTNLHRPWREELRDPAATEDSLVELRRAWQRKLYQGGYLGMGWPAEWGGRGATEVEKAIFEAELAGPAPPADPEHPRHRAARTSPDPPRQRNATPAVHSTDALRRRDLVPGLQRAWGRQRPRIAQDRRRTRRRSLRAERTEGVDDLR